MRRLTFAVAATALLATVGATTGARGPDADPVLVRLASESAERSQVLDIAGHLCDVHGPRLTASAEARAAAEWARRLVATWGLSDAHLEPWGTFGHAWSVERVSVHLVSPGREPLIALPKPWTVSTPGSVRGQAVKARLANDEDFATWRGRLAKRVVFLGDAPSLPSTDRPALARLSDDELARLKTPAPRPTPPDAKEHVERTRLQKKVVRFLRDERALGAVEFGARDSGTLLVARPYELVAAGQPAGVPMLSMTAEHYGRVIRLLDRGVPVELELDVRTRLSADVPECVNVIADLPGNDLADELVIVGAHLDSWHGGTGAVDNAAGVAIAMEALRLLKAVGAQPRRTIRLALWTGEEQGLLGARAYVREHFGHRDEPADEGLRALPFFLRALEGRLHLQGDQRRLSAYFNVDHGSGRIRGIYLGGNTAAQPLVESWFAPLAGLGAGTVSPRAILGSDHQAFESIGVPAFHFIQDPLDYSTRGHHTNMDVFERLSRDDLVQASLVVASVLYQAATSDERVPRPVLEDAGR